MLEVFLELLLEMQGDAVEEIEESGIVVDDVGIDTEIVTGDVEEVGVWLLMSPSRSMIRVGRTCFLILG